MVITLTDPDKNVASLGAETPTRRRTSSTCDYKKNLFHGRVWGTTCEMTFGEDVAVLICYRMERVRSLRLAGETDGKRRGR